MTIELIELFVTTLPGMAKSLLLQSVIRAQKDALSTCESEPIFQENVTEISKDCLEKRLISRKTWERIEDPAQKQKVSLLLNAIKKQMGTNEDVFDIFLYLLQRRESCRKLVEKLKMLVEEAMERNYKAQVAKKKKIVQTQSIVQLNPQQYAIKANLDELIKVCESLLTSLASKCETKRIVSKTVYLEVSRKSGEDKTAKTKKFLLSVCLAVRKDNTKFDAFLDVLKNRQPCLEVVAKIESSLKSFNSSKNELVMAPEKLPLKPFIANRDTNAESGDVAGNPRQSCMGRGIEESANGSVSTSNNEYERTLDVNYQQVMDEKYKQSKELDDLRQQNEKINNEKCEMLLHIHQLQQELSDKEEELRKIEVEKEELVGEVQALTRAANLAKKSDEVKILKNRIAKKEKEIEERNKKIQNLEKRQSDLKKELSEKNTDLADTKEVLRRTIETLQEVRHLSRANSIDNQVIYKQTRCILYVFIAFLVVLFFLILAILTRIM